MAKPDKVTMHKDEMEDLVGVIDGFGEGAEEVLTYLKIYVCGEQDRGAVASVPSLARQWDQLNHWRKDEAKRLAALFHGTADIIAKVAAQYLHTDIEIATTFPKALLNDESVISKRLVEDSKEHGGGPVHRRWAHGAGHKPIADPNLDYSGVEGIGGDG